MQGANSRQYKREMASFEVGSENASTMAGSVLRDERGVRVTGMRGIDIGRRGEDRVGIVQKGGKGAKPVTYEMEMTVSCVAQFLLFLTNLILSRVHPGDRVSASSLRQNVIGYAVNY